MSISKSEPPLLSMREIQGKGRSLFSTQPLKPGQILLKESPILTYSALPLNTHKNNPSFSYCSNCFKLLNPLNPFLIFCPTCCKNAIFCNPNCLSMSLSSSHTNWVCQSLTHLRNNPSQILQNDQDLQTQACFLVGAYNLAKISPSKFETLLSLQGEAQVDEKTQFLHFLVCSLATIEGVGVSLELTAALLGKDKVNAFGLMEPFGEERERSVRAYGIYPMASLFNHDCLPNACRFDYVDRESVEEGSNNTDIIIRAIHDVPEGREICLSYFPVNLKYSDRQKRLKEDYGFTCDCDRCKVEANWSDDEDGLEVDNDEEDDDEEAMDEDCDEDMVGEESENVGGENGDNDFPHAYFFARYMCNRKNCWGTLAPIPPTDAAPSRVMECNVCGNYENVVDGESL